MKSNDPWASLEPDDAKRVNANNQYDFFWVVIETGVPGLLLKLPSLPAPIPRLPKLKNLLTSFRTISGGAAFVIGLKETSQAEIFETLCHDVVEAGEKGNSIEEALQRVIQRTHRWHHLLRGGSKKGLSVEEQRGLVGELSFLKELTHNLGPETAIEAWTGPFGATKDFEFIGTCVEIKAHRVAAKPFISISSAEQLDDVEGCRLFLRVINISSAISPDGETLHDHVTSTTHLFRNSISALDKWEEAIYATGYDPENDYDERRWQISAIKSYEIVEGFPRIMVPLPIGVESVRYAVSLDACSEYETDIDLSEAIKSGLKNG